MRELDAIFKRIKKENIDFQERVDRGDLYVPHILLKDKRLKARDYIYISSYYCYGKDIKKADKYSGLEKLELARLKKRLNKFGYLKIKNNNAEKLKKKTIQLSHKENLCEWCGEKCYILQEHHYPIPAKDGGTEVVNICPNCHYTFHKLESEKYI